MDQSPSDAIMVHNSRKSSLLWTSEDLKGPESTPETGPLPKKKDE